MVVVVGPTVVVVVEATCGAVVDGESEWLESLEHAVKPVAPITSTASALYRATTYDTLTAGRTLRAGTLISRRSGRTGSGS